jgi:hypothetical protein
MVRRFSHLTAKGLWSVEIFKDASGGQHWQRLDPADWRPVWRSVRHH